MDVTGLKNDTVTGSGSTSERSYCQETGNYKYMTVRPAENKEVLFNAGNFASDNTGTFGTNSLCSNSLFTFDDCKVSHSRPCSPKSIESERSVEGHQKEAFSSVQVQVKQTKLLAMLTSGEFEKHYVKKELEKLVQQFDELHVNVSLMDKVNKLKREIEQYIDPHRLVGEEYSSKNGAPSRKTIADDIQIIAREIAIWAGTTLIDNCTPYCPDLLFVKAMFAIDGKTGYCLHLKSTKDVPYHLYPYDLDPETKADQICQGLHKYAHDSGVLFSCGLYAPAVIAADHDSVTKRALTSF